MKKFNKNLEFKCVNTFKQFDMLRDLAETCSHGITEIPGELEIKNPLFREILLEFFSYWQYQVMQIVVSKFEMTVSIIFQTETDTSLSLLADRFAFNLTINCNNNLYALKIFELNQWNTTGDVASYLPDEIHQILNSNNFKLIN